MTDEFTTRLLVRAADLRDKFVDGRASAFKRDFPGWFAAFTEVLGFLTEAAARIRDSDRERDAALARVGDVAEALQTVRRMPLTHALEGCYGGPCDCGIGSLRDLIDDELIRAATGGDKEKAATPEEGAARIGEG